MDDATDFDTGQRDHFIAGFMDSFPGSLRDGLLFYWVAELDNRLIAVMTVRKVPKVPSPSQHDACWGYLTNCYTLPEHRSRGVGSRLLANIKEWCKEQGLELLVVWPSERSYAFYGRAGFCRYDDPLVLNLEEEP